MFCNRCREFYPPGFTESVDGSKDNLCLFCKRDVNSLTHKGQIVTKQSIVEKYKIALKMIKEENDIIKQGKLNKLPGKIFMR